LFYLYLCLSRGVQVIGVAWRATTRIVARVEDLIQWIDDGCTGRVLSGWTIERPGGGMCSLHRARGDEKREFLSWASKQRSTVYQWFGVKTTGAVFSVLASKPVVMVSLL
jgi:hypothetical protein